MRAKPAVMLLLLAQASVLTADLAEVRVDEVHAAAQRQCGPPDVVRADVVVVVVGGRPSPGLLQGVIDVATNWLRPINPGRAAVRIAVAQHSGGHGDELELLTGRGKGGFVQSSIGLRNLRTESFRPATCILRPKWRATAVALGPAYAALAAMADSSELSRREGVAQRVLLIGTGQGLRLCDKSAANELIRLQTSLDIDIESARHIVAAVRVRAKNLRRKVLALQSMRQNSEPGGDVAAMGTARVEALRLAFVLDGADGIFPFELVRAVYGEAALEDGYHDGTEGATGVTFFRLRDSCRNKWHPICPTGGCLQVRLLHDGTPTRVVRLGSSDRGNFSATRLHRLLPLPPALLPACTPAQPWALMPADSAAMRPSSAADGPDMATKSSHTSQSTCTLHSDGQATKPQRIVGGRFSQQDKAPTVGKPSWERKVAEKAHRVDEGYASKMIEDANSAVLDPELDIGLAFELPEHWKIRKQDSSGVLADTIPSPLVEEPTSTRSSNTVDAQDSHVHLQIVPEFKWREEGVDESKLYDKIITASTPVLLRGTKFQSWIKFEDGSNEVASRWNPEHLQRVLSGHTMTDTKRSRSAHTTGTSAEVFSPSFFDADDRAPMMWAGLLSHTNMESDGTVAATSLPYTTHNLSSDALLEAIFKPKQPQAPRYYHFAKIPDILREEPELRKIARSMFLRDSDFERYEQYLWLSSAGVKMHPHVDADHNFYVQVRGTKRWTLYPTFLTPTMRPFPRIHPLWHKSQLHHNSPTNVAKPADMARFPAPLWSTEGFLSTPLSLGSTTNASVAASAVGDGGVMVVDLSPGDVLYVPPYTWHSVESLTPSISLSSWSDNSNVRTLMQHLYRAQPHEFDALRSRRGRLFALRTYVETLLNGIFGPHPDAAQMWMERHVSTRYRGLEYLFPSAFTNITATEEIPILPRRCRGAPRVGDCAVLIGQGALIHASELCANPAHPGKVPVSPELATELKFQAETATNVLLALPSPESRDLLLGDYIDELAADVIGPHRVLAFLSHCFRGQSYLITRCDTEVCHPESMLWSYYD